MLEYFALFMVFFVAIVIFYGIIVIHDIPYEIAVERNHPHQDAIHAAGWVSLFTLHVLWPFLWIWATIYKEGVGWGFKDSTKEKSGSSNIEQELQNLKQELESLKTQITKQNTTKAPAENDAEIITDNNEQGA